MSLDDRFDIFCDIELWAEAADIAYRMKDATRLQEVARSCRDRDMQKQIQDMMAKL